MLWGLLEKKKSSEKNQALSIYCDRGFWDGCPDAEVCQLWMCWKHPFKLPITDVEKDMGTDSKIVVRAEMKHIDFRM